MTDSVRPAKPPRRTCIAPGCDASPRYPNRDESSYCAAHEDLRETRRWLEWALDCLDGVDEAAAAGEIAASSTEYAANKANARAVLQRENTNAE